MEDYSKLRNKPSTQDGYQSVIDRNIVPMIGRMKVQDVKRPDVAGMMKKMTHKPADANRTFSVMRRMFNLAEVWGYRPDGTNPRSEEHTSELQSLMRISYAVFCLKKKKINTRTITKRKTNKKKIKTQVPSHNNNLID